MKKVNHQREYAASCQSQGNQIDLFGNVVARRTLSDGTLSMLLGKNKRDSALSSWRVIGGDDFAFFKSGSSEVTVVNLSGVESTWRWSTPSGVFAGGSNYGERVFGGEFVNSKPADNYSSERIVDLNSFSGVNNFGADYENPEQSAGCKGIAYANPTFGYKSRVEKTYRNTKANEDSDTKVNPIASGAINIIIGHVSNTTTTLTEKSEYLLAKKGN
ncbi:MAG: hypothetical protein EBT82_03645 [Micrococcales bacterium]|nr:hypothetical protein [Micrococcales bacterium]NBR55050.1 hypothetical protein [Micrococcales bacterium]NBR61670.1 hypothetical protein [Actinomycetota bacterium]NBY43600.1 hypothetical protein [Micrococcales bacterium]